MPAPNDLATAFRELNSFLLSFGWLLPPKILGGELHELWDRCERLRRTPSQDEAARRRNEDEISQVLVFTAFRPNHRAYYVWLAMQQPHASSFSHLIEAAVIHYFGRDYLSCVNCLIPAIEGILRSHFRLHNPNHVGRISHGAMRRFLRAERPTRSYPELHIIYREALHNFLGRWLWEDTDDVDWTLSYLNRHYIVHGMGNEHYYRSEDCHRLMMFLDVYEEMLVLETGIGQHPLIPQDRGIDRRRRYYEARLIWSEWTRAISRRVALLQEHPHYHDEPPRESFLQHLTRWAEIMGLGRDLPRR